MDEVTDTMQLFAGVPKSPKRNGQPPATSAQLVETQSFFHQSVTLGVLQPSPVSVSNELFFILSVRFPRR